MRGTGENKKDTATPACITSHIQPNAQLLIPAKFLDHRVPRVSLTTRNLMCRSKSGCGPTNDQAVDSPHNVLTSNAFPDNVVTNVFFHRILFNKLYNPCIPIMQDFMPRP